MIDVSETIIANSDQLNAVDLPPQSLVVVVTAVKKVRSDQPLDIEIAGFEGRPYKPCLSMRRVLAQAWGTDASKWVGRSMTLYCENSVKWAGKAVGGIRVSHLSHIAAEINIPIAVSRHVRELYSVLQMPDYLSAYKAIVESINNAKTDEELINIRPEIKKVTSMPSVYLEEIYRLGSDKKQSFTKTKPEESK